MRRKKKLEIRQKETKGKIKEEMTGTERWTEKGFSLKKKKAENTTKMT